MLIDLRRQFAFKAGDHLIIGASYNPPEALDIAWNTIAARVEQLMDSLGLNPYPPFGSLAPSDRAPLIARTIWSFSRNH